MEELQPGELIAGKYQIERELGHGGMAVVYRAWDATLERPVALKVLPPEFTFDKNFVDRFIREAKSAARLQHPNIITIFEAGESQGTFFIAMELVEGEALDGKISRGMISEREAVIIARKIALALDHAHGKGLVHRDIKPGNIMIRKMDGEPLLMDFGIAHAEDGIGLTRAGMIIGTPEYMSPEQIEGPEAGPASDFYSLGILLYKMLCGQEPFMGTTTEILYKHAHEQPAPLNTMNPSVPPGISEVVNRLLSKNPRQRFQSGRELAAALESSGQYTRRKPTVPAGVSAKPAQTISGPGTLPPKVQARASGRPLVQIKPPADLKRPGGGRKKNILLVLAGVTGVMGLTAIISIIVIMNVNTGRQSGGGGGGGGGDKGRPGGISGGKDKTNTPGQAPPWSQWGGTSGGKDKKNTPTWEECLKEKLKVDDYFVANHDKLKELIRKYPDLEKADDAIRHGIKVDLESLRKLVRKFTSESFWFAGGNTACADIIADGIIEVIGCRDSVGKFIELLGRQNSQDIEEMNKKYPYEQLVKEGKFSEARPQAILAMREYLAASGGDVNCAEPMAMKLIEGSMRFPGASQPGPSPPPAASNGAGNQ